MACVEPQTAKGSLTRAPFAVSAPLQRRMPWLAIAFGMSPTKEDFTVKLSRLLATLALIAGALAVPAPASATIEQGRLSPATVRSICTTFAGNYTDDRLVYTCEISSGTISCAMICAFHLSTQLPPLAAECELARGILVHSMPNEFACQLRQGDEFSISCPGRPGLATMIVCEVRFPEPSEQPME